MLLFQINPCWFAPGMVWDSYWRPGSFDPPYKMDRPLSEFLATDTRGIRYPITLAGGVVSTLGLEGDFRPFRETPFWIPTREMTFGAIRALEPLDTTRPVDDPGSFAAFGPQGFYFGESEDLWKKSFILCSALDTLPRHTPILISAFDASPHACHHIANKRVLEVIKSVCLDPSRTLVLQGFRGSVATVEAWRAFPTRTFFSISGSVAFFSNAEREGLRAIPRTQLLVESSSPSYPLGTSHPMSPIFLGEVIALVAEVRGDSFEEVARYTFINGLSAFQALMCHNRPFAN